MSEPICILLVEDCDADVYLFRKALTAAALKFELIVIEDGGQAIAFIRNEGNYAGSPVPKLAVIDLSLPKKDGIQVVEAMRQAERFADVPVVLVSSSPNPPTRVNLEQLRVARYIAKPLDLLSFLQLGSVLKEILL